MTRTELLKRLKEGLEEFELLYAKRGWQTLLLRACYEQIERDGKDVDYKDLLEQHLRATEAFIGRMANFNEDEQG